MSYEPYEPVPPPVQAPRMIVVRRRRRTARVRKEEPSMVWFIVQTVVGGVVGIALALLISAYIAEVTPQEVVQKVLGVR